MHLYSAGKVVRACENGKICTEVSGDTNHNILKRCSGRDFRVKT